MARKPKIIANILHWQYGSIVGTRKTIGLDRCSIRSENAGHSIMSGNQISGLCKVVDGVIITLMGVA